VSIAPSLLLAFVPRACILWLCGRAISFVLVALAAELDAAIYIVVSTPASLAPAAIIVAALLGAVEVVVRRERVLLGNLGLPAATAVAVVTGVAAVFEALVWAVTAS
jgi:hypothetical protein